MVNTTKLLLLCLIDSERLLVSFRVAIMAGNQRFLALELCTHRVCIKTSISDAILNADPATLPIDFDALALKDENKKDEEENHGKSKAVSGEDGDEDGDSETTKGAPPTPASAESSFDSYWGGGMTQEAHF